MFVYAAVQTKIRHTEIHTNLYAAFTLTVSFIWSRVFGHFLALVGRLASFLEIHM